MISELFIQSILLGIVAVAVIIIIALTARVLRDRSADVYSPVKSAVIPEQVPHHPGNF